MAAVEGAGAAPSPARVTHRCQTVQSVDANVQSVEDAKVQSVEVNVQSVDFAKVQSVEVKVQSVDSARFIMTVSLWDVLRLCDGVKKGEDYSE